MVDEAGRWCRNGSASAQTGKTGNEKEIEAILASAEDLFKAMKEKNYPALWNLLSNKSQDSIVGNIQKNAEKAGVGFSRDQINSDFLIGGLISRTYWNKYLTVFDPDIPLEQSKWDMDFLKENKAQIRLQYIKAGKPIFLQMYKESTGWKVGLEETFSAREWLLR